MASSRRRTEIAKKGHKPDEIIAKLRQVDVLASQGRSMAEFIQVTERGRGVLNEIDPPPSKWSALRYGFEPEEDRDGEQEAPA